VKTCSTTDHRLRLLHIIGQLHKGGAERQLHLLSSGLDRSRWAVRVLCLSEGGYWRDRLIDEGIEVLELRRRGSWDIWRLATVRGIVRRLRPHLLHTWMWEGNSYGRLAALGLGDLKRVAAERVMDPTRRSWQKMLDRFLARRTDLLICNSGDSATWARREMGFATDRVRVIHNGLEFVDPPGEVRLRALRHELRIPETSRVLLSAGRLIPQKRQEDYIGACARLAGDFGDLHFLLAGDGPLRGALEALVAKTSLDERFHFLGVRDDLPELMSLATVFCLSSVYEGLSNVLMEAACLGVPVVATQASGNDEIIEDGRSGYLTPLRDQAALADRIAQLLNDPDQLREIGRNGRRRARERFSIARMVAEYEDAYLSLLN